MIHSMRIALSIVLLFGIVFFMPLPENGAALEGLDPSPLRFLNISLPPLCCRRLNGRPGGRFP